MDSINRLPVSFQGILSFYLYGIQDKNELAHIFKYILGTMLFPKIDPDEIDFVFHRASAEIAEKGHLWMETYYWSNWPSGIQN